MNNLYIDGFLNISFGENKESVIEKIINRNGILDSENSTDDLLFFNDLKFAGRDTELIIFNFINDKFCRAMVFIKAHLESRTIDLYQQIKEEISEKYYVSDSTFEKYDFPYEQNDGHTLTAISLGKANFSCFWSFDSQNSTSKDYISIEINENLNIIIIYENGMLMKEFEDNRKQIDFQDY